jgi:putative flippase GtrA
MIKKLYSLLNRETVTYLIFGVLTTAVGFGTYWLFCEAGLDVVPANTLSSIIAVVFAFFTNKTFVFRAASWRPAVVAREFLSFCAGRLGTYLMETFLLWLMVDYIGLPNLPCKCFTMVLVVVGNYIISKWAVFRKKEG